jgi:hypothetical protein
VNASASVDASASNAITTTTTTGPTVFWDVEVGVGALAVAEGTPLLALAAAKAKNDPPVSHELVDIDVDKEVHGEDDYMPPPDASGNGGFQLDPRAISKIYNWDGQKFCPRKDCL